MSETENLAYPMFAEEGEDFVLGYMCLTDFEFELGAAVGGCTVYPSIGDIEDKRICVKNCGIVEVKVSASRVVRERSEDF